MTLAVLVTCLNLRAAPPDRSPPSDQPTVQWTEPVNVVYIEDKGPYWGPAPLFRQVNVLAAKHGLTSPMFTRYLDDPSSGSTSLSFQVGIFVPKPLQVDPPFRRADWPREYVVTRSFDGSRRGSTEQWAKLIEWARQHDLNPLGPVVEVYFPASGSEDGDPRTELRLLVEPPKESSASQPVVEPNGRGARASPSSGQVLTPSAQPPPQPQDEEIIADPEPIASLITSADFDRIARQLLPSRRAYSDEEYLFWDQFAFRVGAMGRWLREAYGSEAASITALCDAITARYERIMTSDRPAPSAHSVVRVTVPTGEADPVLRSALRDVEALLGRCLVRAADPPAALTDLTLILQTLQDRTVLPNPTDPEP